PRRRGRRVQWDGQWRSDARIQQSWCLELFAGESGGRGRALPRRRRGRRPRWRWRASLGRLSMYSNVCAGLRGRSPEECNMSCYPGYRFHRAVRHGLAALVLAFTLAGGTRVAALAASDQRTFASPDEATAALAEAVRADDS